MANEERPPLGPFPQGVNNIAKEDSLPEGSLRKALNVDLDAFGWPARRAGRTNRVSATRAHSLFEIPEHILAVVDGDLVAIDPGYASTTIRAGIGPRFVSYTEFNEDVFWSNGITHRRLAADLSDHPAGLTTPRTPIATATASGGLAAGEYQVSLVWRDAQGRQSGASPPVLVQVSANGGILLTDLPVSAEDAAWLQVYASPPNGDVLYRAYEVLAGTTTLMLAAHQPGPALATQWLEPLPAGHILRTFAGRRLVAFGPYLGWSEPLRPSLWHPDNHLRMGDGLALMEPVGEGGDGAGVFLADQKRTYFLSGARPATWQRVIRYGHSAVPGTSLVVPGNVLGFDTTAPVAFWLASNGVFVAGLPGGTVVPITEGRLALPEGERGTSTFREFDGIRQIVTSFLSGGRNSAAVSDSAVASVRRHGLTLD